jgi:cytochrome c553
MTDFKAGSRSNDRARVMRALAARMTEEEVKAVAEYVAGLSGAK